MSGTASNGTVLIAPTAVLAASGITLNAIGTSVSAIVPPTSTRSNSNGGRESPSTPPFSRVRGLVDLRIRAIRPLIPPACLLEELPLPIDVQESIMNWREEVCDILHGRSDRILVVVGPCSIHDPVAALEYARRLLPLHRHHSKDLLIVMRAYLEKPRTTVGWKGLINDPELDGSFRINSGLRIARKLLIDLNEVGLPLATEILDTITPQFMGDLISW
jgi:3-deoxy-7-phosphoheptulonate synthase